MQRTTSLIAFAAALTFACNLLAGTELGSQSSTSTPPRAATIAEIRDEVEAHLTRSDPWATAAVGSVLQVGGGVRTLAVGFARIDLSEGTIIRLAPDSSFTLAALDPADPLTRLQLLAGKVWVVLTDGELAVETPNGVAAVRGSFLSVEWNPEARTTGIVCFEGNCSVETTGGEVTTLTTAQQVEISDPEAPPPTPEPISDEAVTDWLANNPEATAIVPTLTAVSRVTPSPTSEHTPTPSRGRTLSPTPTVESDSDRPTPTPTREDKDLRTPARTPTPPADSLIRTPTPLTGSLPVTTLTPIPTTADLPAPTLTPIPTTADLPDPTRTPTQEDKDLPTSTHTPTPRDEELPTPTHTLPPPTTAPPAPTSTPAPPTSTPTPPTNDPTPTSTPDAGSRLMVLGANAAASPTEFTGSCPFTFAFSGSIATNGVQGTVTYHWERSDGASGPTLTLQFNTNETEKAVENTTWTLGAAGAVYQGWEQIAVESPNSLTSNSARFTLTCTN